MEPGWFINFTPFWFRADLFDEASGKFTLTSPGVVRTFEWVRGYSIRLGKGAMTEFKSGMSGVNSPQNPFLIGSVAMVQQGAWEANFIEDLAPALNRWGRFEREEPAMIAAGVADPGERWRRFEREVADELRDLRRSSAGRRCGGRSSGECAGRGGPAGELPVGGGAVSLGRFGAGGTELHRLRRAGHPARGEHKAEAFEFIAYVNRQDVTEKLNMMHWKDSPLQRVSEAFMSRHPNPHIGVFEQLASSPNSRGVPRCPIWPEVVAEMDATTQKVYLLEQEPAAALAEAQRRLQARLDQFNARRAARDNSLSEAGSASSARCAAPFSGPPAPSDEGGGEVALTAIPVEAGKDPHPTLSRSTGRGNQSQSVVRNS